MSAKKILTLVAVFALSFVIMSIAKRKFAEVEPKKTVMRLSYDTYDFKMLKRYSPSQTYFYITNEGDYLLKINEIESVCGCTVPEWPKVAIPPGKRIVFW